jgi:hypothetical protein
MIGAPDLKIQITEKTYYRWPNGVNQGQRRICHDVSLSQKP